MITLNPLNWFNNTGGEGQKSGITTRKTDPLGPYTAMFESWVAREVNPFLYEALRESVAPIDGAINKLVTLDGILRVEGGNDQITALIEEWMSNVPVNDLEVGLQSFYRSLGNEMYEQGFSIGEPRIEQDAISGLRVADSKGVIFERNLQGGLNCWYLPPKQKRGRRDGTDNIERVLRNGYQSESLMPMLKENGYRMIDPTLLVYAAFNPEADGPYGTSIMRSTEFDAKVLLVMKNSLMRTWERFGDPIFNVTYKTKAKVSPQQLEERKQSIAVNLAAAMRVKASGNSADVVNAVGRDDEIDIKILGGDGQVLEIEAPARHILEQIVSKTGLPSWMLGFHWSTAERLAQRQGEIALQESRTRFETRKPGLERIIATMLRLRGESWKRGDWYLTQDLPSLQDILAQAQARFLNTQADMMEGGRTPNPPEGGDSGPKFAGVSRLGEIRWPTDEKHDCGCHHHKSTTIRHKSEQYIEDAPALVALEDRAVTALIQSWHQLYGDVTAALGLDEEGKSTSPVWQFEPTSMFVLLMELMDGFIDQNGTEDAAWQQATYEAWARGVTNAAAELQVEDGIEQAIRDQIQQAMAQRGMELVTETTIRTLKDDIITTLEQGALDGLNPKEVARKLRSRFEVHDYDWERLARTEIAEAQIQGKLTLYADEGIAEYDWVAAIDGCPICKGLERGGPYQVGSGPTIAGDSHPHCRCSITAG